MEISPFELLLKPIAPRGFDTNIVNKLARNVVQGYFLTISNLKNKERNLVFKFTISAPQQPPDNANVSRIFENRVILLFDVAGKNLSLSLKRIEDNNSFIKYESDNLLLPSLATVSVQLLPDITVFLKNSQALLEVRGFASIEAEDKESGELFLNPEIRGTFIPNDLTTNPSPDIDQLSYSLGIRTITI
jgi:hypothetical protein